MAAADNLPAEGTLAVPQTFQDEVTRRQSRRYLLMILGSLGLFVLLPLIIKSHPFFDVGAVLLIANAVV